MIDLILASSSPRRIALLQKLNISFKTFSPNIDESYSPDEAPQNIVQSLSLRKASEAYKIYPNAIIIGSDTIVVSEEKILGKPQNRSDAKSMLTHLSGRIHSVFTGVSIINQGEPITFYEKTNVEFWPLTEEEIERYLDSGEPFDKAGAYGIQGAGALLVKAVYGDYYSVVGLPISRLVRYLMKYDHNH